MIKKFVDDGVEQLGVQVAYWGFFSVFALLRAFASILGLVLQSDPVPFAHHGSGHDSPRFPGAPLATGCWLGLPALGGVYVTQVLPEAARPTGALLRVWACSRGC